MMIEAPGIMILNTHLTLVSNGIACITTWEVFNKSPVGSDHYPIRTKLGVVVHQEEDIRITRSRNNTKRCRMQKGK